jgi:hypothetical protein
MRPPFETAGCGGDDEGAGVGDVGVYHKLSNGNKLKKCDISS